VPADWDHVWLPYWLGLLDKSGELLDFYELIHVIQWRLLGPEAFLATYAAGLETFGYRNSPLERMAYDAEASFCQSDQPFDAANLVAEQLGRMQGIEQ
jgi:hypothetical protein